jgi:hypothetical protein
MSKTKKPRNKPYRPKMTAAGGGLMALVRIEDRARHRAVLSSPYAEEDRNDLATAYWRAFGDLKSGTATEEAWSNVAASVNMALLLAEGGLGEECTPEIVPALEGLFKAKQRGERHGSYRLDGPGLVAVQNVLKIHDAQMEHATPMDMLNADAELKKRMREGNVYSAERIH